MNGVTTSSDGVPITYEDHGEGTPAIVFVHGWSCDRSYWRGQMEAFPDNRVVAIDLAGHGGSGTGRSSWTIPAFGADVAAVVDRLGLQDVVLVGHSMGGDAILETALLQAQRVRGLIWVDVYRSLGEPGNPAEIEEFIAPFRLDFAGEAKAFFRGMFLPNADPELVDWVAADVAAAPPDIALDAMRHSIGNEARVIEILAEISIPVVALNPDYRPTDAASLRRHGVRPVIMTDVGHFLMLEDPIQFNGVLAELVTGFPQPLVG